MTMARALCPLLAGCALLFLWPSAEARADVTVSTGPRWESLSGYTSRSGVNVMNVEIGLLLPRSEGDGLGVSFRAQRESSFGNRVSGMDGALTYSLGLSGGVPTGAAPVGGLATVARDHVSLLAFESTVALSRRTLEVFGDLGALEAATDFLGARAGLRGEWHAAPGLSLFARVAAGAAFSIGAFEASRFDADLSLGAAWRP